MYKLPLRYFPSVCTRGKFRHTPVANGVKIWLGTNWVCLPPCQSWVIVNSKVMHVKFGKINAFWEHLSNPYVFPSAHAHVWVFIQQPSWPLIWWLCAFVGIQFVAQIAQPWGISCKQQQQQHACAHAFVWAYVKQPCGPLTACLCHSVRLIVQCRAMLPQKKHPNVVVVRPSSLQYVYG